MLGTCTPTGVDALDRLTGGLADGELVVVGGRPSAGKTALLAMISRSMTERAEGSVFFCSPEMTEAALRRRVGKSERVRIVDEQRLSLDGFCDAVRSAAGRTMVGGVLVDQTELLLCGEASCWDAAGLKLRSLAAEVGLPLVATAQLRRFAGPRPALADLAGGAAVADAAHTVFLLHEPGTFGKRVEIVLAKHPSGRTGVTRFVLPA